MTLNKQSPAIAKLIKGINENRSANPAKMLKLSLDLYDKAMAEGNDDLKDLASCYLGEACCQNHDLEQAYYYLSSGITGLAKTDEYELICRVYNELGILLQNQSNYISAQEAFMCCISIGRANRLYLFEAMGCQNFASLCEELNDYEDALLYRYRCLECYELTEQSPQERAPYIIANISYIVNLYVLQDNKELAMSSYSDLLAMLRDYPEYEDTFEVWISKLYYNNYVSDEKQELIAKENCLRHFNICEDYTIYFDELTALATYLLMTKDYSELETLLDNMEKTCVEQSFVNHNLHIASLRIQMYTELGDQEKVKDAAYLYVTHAENKKAEIDKSFALTLKLQRDLAQQKASNLFLSEQADRDSLTGIANRKKLNEVIDELFIVANKEGKSLGVEILDIDFFKEVNDTMGHKAGDELLICMANILKQIQSDNIFVARYGGDEFIVYYYDMTDMEILEKAKFIRNEIELLRQAMQLPLLSVSQGIVNHVPLPLNRAWDYMNVADETLYYVKGNGKDNARIVHSLMELKNQPWDKPF